MLSIPGIIALFARISETTPGLWYTDRVLSDESFITDRDEVEEACATRRITRVLGIKA